MMFTVLARDGQQGLWHAGTELAREEGSVDASSQGVATPGDVGDTAILSLSSGHASRGPVRFSRESATQGGTRLEESPLAIPFLSKCASLSSPETICDERLTNVPPAHMRIAFYLPKFRW